MEFDPSARDGPPPRHAIESDSEESDGGEGASTRDGRKNSNKKAFQAPEVRIESVTGQLPSGLPLLLLLGESGESYARTVDRNAHAGVSSHVLVDGKVQGSLIASSTSVVGLLRLDARLCCDPSTYAHIAAALLVQLKPSRLVLVDEYLTALYIHDDRHDRQSDQTPAVRIFHGSTAALPQAPFASFAPPNYLTGFPAAVIAEALIADLPLTALLLPQNHTFNPHLQSLHTVRQSSDALQSRPAELEEPLRNTVSKALVTLLGLSAKQTTETHSEKLGDFLQRRRIEARKHQKQEVSSMYM